MSIRDDVNEISENNVTIAENLQKVYEAGVRAGLSQDPDYAEGFEDGHEQGLSDASGVVWEELLNGKVAVGRAKEADHAAEATHATSATLADRTSLADRATTANEATNANHASNADYAADAGHAAEADHSAEADHATEATHSELADRATMADHASTATIATTASDIGFILPIEKGGTGATTADEALINLGVTTYQKPWDLNENVGPIVVYKDEKTEWRDGTTVTNGYKKTNTYNVGSYIMINSGEVKFTFSSSLYGDGSGIPYSALYRAAIIVTQNGKEVFTVEVIGSDDLTSEEARDKLNRDYSVPLTVKKGDRIAMRVELDYPSSGSSGPFVNPNYIKNIGLSANIDTPYKYIYFF